MPSLKETSGSCDGSNEQMVGKKSKMQFFEDKALVNGIPEIRPEMNESRCFSRHFPPFCDEEAVFGNRFGAARGAAVNNY